jgi:16S rRNA (guanine527-N7)-methyltransferase
LEQILKYFNELNNKQIDQFSALYKLYFDWNEKINVISRKDIDHLYERHVLHSLAISKLIRFKSGTSILDIGTGGGFPGIPLAIMFPEVKFLLIDSIGKKIKVVEDIVKNLNLTNLEAKHQHSNELKQKFDFIVSRAVTAFPEFVKLASGKIKGININSLPNGIIYLKGGDLTNELKIYRKDLVLHPISDFFNEEFFETKYIVYYPM